MNKKIIAKVWRTEIKESPQEEFLRRVKTFISLTDQVPEYKGVQPSISAIKPLAERFDRCLDTIKEGSPKETRERTACRKELKAALSVCYDAMDENANGEVSFIENASLVCLGSNKANKKTALVPTILDVQNTLNPTEFTIVLEDNIVARMYGFEWSNDGGKTRQNGTYSTSLTAKITVVPGPEIMIWACALRSKQRKSDFSTPFVKKLY
jgi:hypothetical protein